MAFTTCVCNVSKSALSNYIDIAIHIRCPIISIPMEAALSLLLSSIHILLIGDIIYEFNCVFLCVSCFNSLVDSAFFFAFCFSLFWGGNLKHWSC